MNKKLFIWWQWFPIYWIFEDSEIQAKIKLANYIDNLLENEFSITADHIKFDNCIGNEYIFRALEENAGYIYIWRINWWINILIFSDTDENARLKLMEHTEDSSKENNYFIEKVRIIN